MVYSLEQEQFLPISMEQAWDFFSSPKNLDSITPRDLGFKITSNPGPMHEGQIITYKVMIFPGIWVPWVTEIKSVDPGYSFIDEQRFGPYRFWHHRHTFEEVDGGVLMKDLVHYALPLGAGLLPVHRLLVRPKLERIFGYRRQVLQQRFG
jgi:ligand-binding SRPBCC domain-containing protein